MNYFGLFFSFMVPGIVIGVMAAVAFYQEAKARARRAAQRRGNAARLTAPRDRLYVHDLSKAA
jgi:MFS superfamily sulfate permease-like transporter